MKNKLYIWGVVCVLIILIGCMFKISHWTGAGIILTLGFFLFTFVFMPLALVKSFRTETDKKLATLYVIAYISVLIVTVGALFKIQHWPGAGMLMMISIPLPFVLFLPGYLLSIRKNKQLNYNNLLLVLFFFAYFAVITALLALNVSKDVIDEYVDVTYSQEKCANLNTGLTDTMIEGHLARSASDSAKRELILKIREKVKGVCQLIDNMKVGIVKNIDAKNQQFIDASGAIDYQHVAGKDNKSIDYRPVFHEKANELKNKLDDYREFLLKNVKSSDNDFVTYINRSLGTAPDWTFSKFEGKRLIAIIETLSSIKNVVSQTEFEIVSLP